MLLVPLPVASLTVIGTFDQGESPAHDYLNYARRISRWYRGRQSPPDIRDNCRPTGGLRRKQQPPVGLKRRSSGACHLSTTITALRGDHRISSTTRIIASIAG